MNDLVTMSDKELDNAIEAVKERELALHTENGRRFIVSKMREMIMHLEAVGYKMDFDELALAELWANSLADEFIRLGADGMKEAVDNWIAEDASEYRTFPKIPWIKEACHKITGDPRVEKGRRIQAELERKMEEDHKREVEEMKEKRPDLMARVQKRLMELDKKGALNDCDILGEINNLR